MEKCSQNDNVNSKIPISAHIEFSPEYEQILNSLEQYDYKLPTIDRVFACGTSGFRYDENELDKVSFRIAIVTSIKSQFYGGLPMGIMVTASHNKYTDNGFKIAGLDGECISKFWEDKFTDIVNSKNLSVDIKKLIVELAYTDGAVSKYFFVNNLPILVFACDTRRSSPKLINIITDCLKILNVKFKFYGVQTTPALHFLTLLNQINFKEKNIQAFYFVDSEEYWKFLKNGYLAFNSFLEKFYFNFNQRKEERKYENEFTIDCSNGIAGYHYKNIMNLFEDSTIIHAYNNIYQDSTGLNERCGAEFVHKEKKLPLNYGTNVYLKNLSFDGDVDRIVYFYNDGSEIKIIEGDHLNCLFALTVKFLIGKLSPNVQKKFLSEISIGVIVTAYSNGAFINYIKNNLDFQLARAKTGVKHLSVEAKKFDIATYFESNGHGTLTYDNSIKSKIEKLESLVESSTDAQILELLSIYISMFNKTVGDSLSALICVESSMKLMNMSTKELYEIYKELEYVNIKAQVKDKNIFIPNDDESRLIQPLEAQSFIDQTIYKYPNCNARCFVRPSGTEEIVRIYAEADTLEVAVEISETVKKHIIENY